MWIKHFLQHGSKKQTFPAHESGMLINRLAKVEKQQNINRNVAYPQKNARCIHFILFIKEKR